MNSDFNILLACLFLGLFGTVTAFITYRMGRLKGMTTNNDKIFNNKIESEKRLDKSIMVIKDFVDRLNRSYIKQNELREENELLNIQIKDLEKQHEDIYDKGKAVGKMESIRGMGIEFFNEHKQLEIEPSGTITETELLIDIWQKYAL